MEADYLDFLAKVQKAVKENPADVEFDFPQSISNLNLKKDKPETPKVS